MDQLKAFTLMESMVAMVIVMVVFSLSSITILTVTGSGMSQQKMEAYFLVKSWRNQTLKTQRFLDESKEIHEIRLEQFILDYRGSGALQILNIKAFHGKHQLYESQDLFINSEEQ